MKKLQILLVIALGVSNLSAQSTDSIKKIELKTLEVNSYRTINGIGQLNDININEGVIYSGKKTEVIVIDSLNANKAVNDTRQILGRIPGLNIIESESGGFISNGVGLRGLNPNQSLEMNVRQNGYNISGDVYGYNETYYVPPLEAVQSIEVIRGAASLQYGAHFGGVINYTVKEIPTDKTYFAEIAQTVGSYGLFNTYGAVGFRKRYWSGFAFAQNRLLSGWRANTDQKQFSGYAKIQYKPNEQFSLALEYSALRNTIHMPGGLTDSLFYDNPRQSNRARNWIESPWNVLSLKARYFYNEKTSINFSTTYLNAARNLIWFLTDDPSDADQVDPATKKFASREVEIENIYSISSEARLLHRYQLLGNKNTLACGIRLSYSNFQRLEEGKGDTGSNFNLNAVAFGKNQTFSTTNVAPFIENIFQLTEKLSITPGIRLEYLRSTAEGYSHDNSNSVFSVNEEKKRAVLLVGLGTQFKSSRFTNVYANISQAYRPIDYSQLSPLGSISQIDPNLRDAKGYNADVGFRGTVQNFLNFDVGLFYINYQNRIGLITLTDLSGSSYLFRTNIANSIHKGFESYVECNFSKLLNPKILKGGVSVFNSLTYTNAKYSGGEFSNNFVEYAPEWIHRVGLTYATAFGFSVTTQLSEQTQSFTDANNTIFNAEGLVGIVPYYKVFDISASYNAKSFSIKGGINNFTNEKYFTHRTDEYPGPGIISAVGRNVYLGVSFRL